MMNGYDTVTCSNFEHALKIYYKSQTHLVVTDIFMPEMDDIEGIQRLKLSGPRQPYYRNVRGMSRQTRSNSATIPFMTSDSRTAVAVARSENS
jgi:CheY-like chemotaxis protein